MGKVQKDAKAAPTIVKLTKALAERAQPGSGTDGPKAKVYWDAELKGFGLRVGARSKTFIMQRRVKGVTKQPRQITVGSYPALTVDEARDKARGYFNQYKDGIDPEAQRSEEQAGGVTFGEAWTLYQKGMKAKKRSEWTTARYAQYVRTYLQGWLDRPLTQFDPGWLRDQHQQLAVDVARGKYAQEIKHPKKYGKRKGAKVKPENRTGENTANDVFRFLRAVYLRARRQYRTLPSNPFDNLDWFKLRPRRAAIARELLPKWYAGVRKIANPVRRDCLLFMVFTGLRKDSAVSARWEHVDFERRTIFIPKPKGGEERAFYLPLSDYLIDLLEHRKAENAALGKRKLVPANSPWVFPCNADNESESGHMIDPRAKIAGVPFIIHGLRNTFLTEAEAADVSAYAMEALANHRPPASSQTANYLSIDVERLRAPMQTITNRLRALLEGRPPVSNVVPLPTAQQTQAA